MLRYRVMAYVVGTLLIVLVCIGMPLKYIWDNDTVVMYAGIAHGWLYMILLITAFDLGRRARWSWKRLILIALAGTIPFLSFVAERSATKDVRAKLAAYPDYADQSSLPPEAARVHAHPVDSERAHGTPAMAPSKAGDSPAATVE
jgi:integral membrane protein